MASAWSKFSLTLLMCASLLECGALSVLAQRASSGLTVATYNLTPRAPVSENLEQTRAFAANVVSVVKTLLYARGGEQAAMAQGRRMWYDPNTLQLTITDTPQNVSAVTSYIRSVTQPAGKGKSKSAIIPLKHQTAADTAQLLERVTGAKTGATATAGNSVVKTLRVEGELVFRDLRIRVTKVNENDVNDDNDDSVEMVIRTGTTSEDRTIEEFRSEFIDEYEINVIEVRPSGTAGEGSARLEIRLNPQGGAR